MWETMYSANGVGLAAPQIGKSIRIFVVDTKPFSEDEKLTKIESDELACFKKVFINPKIIGLLPPAPLPGINLLIVF